jgi:hypothetical protein
MDYETACEIEISAKQARLEIEKHEGCSWDDFIADCSEKQTYLGSEVLDWLGY